MNYEEELEARELAVKKENQRISDELQLRDLYARNRSLISCDANSQALLQFMGGYPCSAVALDDACLIIKSQLAWQSETDDREKLEKSITALLKQQGSSQSVIESQVRHFRYKSVAELATLHDTLVKQKEMRSKTPAQLRAILQEGKPQPVGLPVEYDREKIVSLPAPQLKALIAKFGYITINERLAKS